MENVLQLEPSTELRFRGPFSEPTQTTMRLTNPSDNWICFKVKTTAPKKYYVRPTCGELRPHSHIDIQVILQPFHYDPNEQQKHKFLVQSMSVADPSSIDHDTIWKTAEPGRIMEAKLRCVLQPSAEVTAESQSSTHSQPWGEPPKTSKTAEVLQQQQQADNTLSAELRRLQEENLSLRRQNISLRQDQQKMRSTGGSVVSDSQTRTSQSIADQSPDPFADASITSIIVMSLILMAVGYVIAKTIF